MNKADITNELLQKLILGEVKFHEMEKHVGAKEAVELRRRALGNILGKTFEQVGYCSIDAERASGRNIENMIGAAQIPLGVAGPVKLMGEYADGEFYIPLATTEGALVASTNRGCSVINAAGGASVRIFGDRMTRAPVFRAKDVAAAARFVDWVKANYGRLVEKAASTTKFGELVGVEPYVAGRSVFLRFAYDTKDAMGMNMATIATDAIVEFIADEFGDVEVVSLSGNMCADKKPAAINAILGRGKTVVAEVEIPNDVILGKLKTTPERMAEVNYRKNLVGSARAASLGFNAHAANIAAAMYIACGQDAAHVVEASSAMTLMELTDTGLHCSVTLPAIQVGTVGGGTQLGTQRECLDMLGVLGAGEPPGANAKKFAEIVAAATLAGEISLIGAQAAGHLAKAHAALGRGK